MTTTKYAYLILGRQQIDGRWVYGDGGQRLVTQNEAAALFESEIRPGLEEKLEAWETAQDAFLGGTTYQQVSTRRDTGGVMKSRVTVEVVTFPDGDRIEVAEGEGPAAAERRFLQINPRPLTPDFYPWWSEQTAQKIRVWRAQLVDENGATELDLGSHDSEWGMPLAAAARVLTRLAAEGWALQHVAEDHGIYAGADAATEAYPTRIRYLLSR